MNKVVYLSSLLLLLAACGSSDSDTPDNGTANGDAPTVMSEATYPVLRELDITYAEGLVHSETSTAPFSTSELGEDTPLKLDVYYPDTTTTNRPVFMFIHGGGFTGGLKDGPEMIEMANYFASRGWVFVSVDYRTTEELCNAKVSTSCKDKVRQMLISDAQNGTDEVVTFYKGIAPTEWIEHAVPLIERPKELQVSIASYAAQRDAKAALRWIMANASTYQINTDFITVGGNSAGSGTTVTLGISNLDDFRDEISISDDPTLSTTNLDQTYTVRSMVHYWGSTGVLDFHEGVYNLEQYDRFDANDPELFMGHGTGEDPQSPYTEAEELKEIYDSLGIYNELATLVLPNGEPAGHGAWTGQVDGKGLFELTFDFLVARQGVNLQ